MSLIKKTIILLKKSPVGYVTVVKVGSETGAKIVGEGFKEGYSACVKIGNANEIVRLSGKKTEFDVHIPFKDTDEIGCVIYSDNTIIAKGGKDIPDKEIFFKEDIKREFEKESRVFDFKTEKRGTVQRTFTETENNFTQNDDKNQSLEISDAIATGNNAFETERRTDKSKKERENNERNYETQRDSQMERESETENKWENESKTDSDFELKSRKDTISENDIKWDSNKVQNKKNDSELVNNENTATEVDSKLASNINLNNKNGVDIATDINLNEKINIEFVNEQANYNERESETNNEKNTVKGSDNLFSRKTDYKKSDSQYGKTKEDKNNQSEISEEQEMFARLAKGKKDFYHGISDKVDEMFIVYPSEDKLSETIPESEWVKINYDSDGYYVVGRLRNNGKVVYLGYGVPGKAGVKPPKVADGIANWFPLQLEGYDGYWLFFQDAETGKID